jgi:hypothetical protein
VTDLVAAYAGWRTSTLALALEAARRGASDRIKIDSQ